MFSVVAGQHKLCQMWSMATFMMCDDINDITSPLSSLHLK